MNVKELAEAENLEILALPDPNAQAQGVYTGDLLSYVMGRVSAGECWVTIMDNINVLAVASLAGCACVVLAENAPASEEFIKTAEAKDVNVLRSSDTSAKLCCVLGRRFGM
ncbi:MAG TPA: DRTGG domain-containing protein [Bacillota bacterium]|nr:DRTGG domain-containing protein [Bacillota bacterium]